METLLKNFTGMTLPTINFGKEILSETEGHKAAMCSLCEVSRENFVGYAARLKEAGYEQVDLHTISGNDFYTYAKEGNGVYLAYYPAISEMRIVAEADSAYLTFADSPLSGKYKTLFTQLDLQDFGLAYTMRLSDGRMIIIDGGCEFVPDAENLMQILREQSPYEKPVIAAWIMTHPHSDHYRCIFPFVEQYADDVVIERFLYNFPEHDPKIERHMMKLMYDTEPAYIDRFESVVEKTGAKIYKPHTGQIYEFANARIEMLSTLDDTLYPAIRDTNPTSLMFMIKTEGQNIFISADGYMKESKLVERYGSYLKSDFYQIPHHGICGGSVEANAIIDPKVCLMPGFEQDWYWFINYDRADCKSLIYDFSVEEVHPGGRNVTFELPYTPGPNSHKLMLDKTAEFRKALGSKSWFFVDYAMEECQFIIVNKVRTVNVYADLLFEDGSKNVSSIKIVAWGGSMTRVDFTDPKKIDGDALFFNHSSLANKGVEPGSRFAIHFRSEEPVVIVGPKAADYPS